MIFILFLISYILSFYYLISCFAMYIFIIINIIKLIIWAIIVYITYNYINLDKDFIIGVITMWVGIFTIIWSISFFIFLWILLLLWKKEKAWITAYKYTGLFAFYLLTNFFLISFNFWNKWIWILILIAFLILWIIF